MTTQQPAYAGLADHAPGTLGTVLVTGGSSGLGAAVVQAVANARGHPVVLDRVPPQEAPPGADYEQVDLVDTRAAEAAVTRALERVGRFDAVVAAAGIDACGRLVDVPGPEWDRVIQVNLLGTAAVVRAALPELERRAGRIVTVASTLGLRGVSDATAYSASKFGVVGFTQALMAELAGRVGVTLLIPGGMDTHFFDGRPEQYLPPSDLTLNRPADVAATVLFALQQPPGVDIRQLVVTPATEGSWP